MSNFYKYLNKSRTVINESPFIATAFVVLTYILSTVLSNNQNQEIKYDRNQVNNEQIEIIKAKAPEIIKKINDDELKKNFDEELKILEQKQKELKEQSTRSPARLVHNPITKEEMRNLLNGNFQHLK